MKKLQFREPIEITSIVNYDHVKKELPTQKLPPPYSNGKLVQRVYMVMFGHLDTITYETRAIVVRPQK
jgi:hypothetical protein